MRLFFAAGLLCGLALANVALAVPPAGIDKMTLANTLNDMINRSKDALDTEMQGFLEPVTAESVGGDFDLGKAAESILAINNRYLYPKLQEEYGLRSLNAQESQEVLDGLENLGERRSDERFRWNRSTKDSGIHAAKVLFCLVYARYGRDKAWAVAIRYLDRIQLARMGGRSGKGYLMPLALAHAAQQANMFPVDPAPVYDAIHPAANAALDKLTIELKRADSDPRDLLNRKPDDPARQQLLKLFVEAYKEHVGRMTDPVPIDLPVEVVKHWLAESSKFALAPVTRDTDYGRKIVKTLPRDVLRAYRAPQAQIGPSAQHHPTPLPPSQAFVAADPHRAGAGYPAVTARESRLPDAALLAQAHSGRGKAYTAADAPYASFTTRGPSNFLDAGPSTVAHQAPAHVRSHYGLDRTAPSPPTASAHTAYPVNLDLSLGLPSEPGPHAPHRSEAVNLDLSLSTGPSSGRSQTAARGKRPMHYTSPSSEQAYPAATSYGDSRHDPEQFAQYPPWGSDGQQWYGYQYGHGGQDPRRRFEGWR